MKQQLQMASTEVKTEVIEAAAVEVTLFHNHCHHQTVPEMAADHPIRSYGLLPRVLTSELHVEFI